MSVQEIKDLLRTLSAEERFELASFLRCLSLEDDGDHAAELEAANERMNAGDKVTLGALRQQLADKGTSQEGE